MQDKQFETAKWVLLGILVFVLIIQLNKFGLLGKSPDEKASDKLGESNAMSDLPGNPLLNDLKKSENKKQLTKADIERQLPNKSKYGTWILDIKYAKGITDDNEEAVFNVFKSLASQFEVSNFATLFKASQNKDLYVYLREFLSDSEMAFIYQLISKKPKVLK